MRKQTAVGLALSEAGLDPTKSNLLRILLICIEGSPLWFAKLFTIDPVSHRAQAQLIENYGSYAAGYNGGGVFAAGFKDVPESKRLPLQFIELSHKLGYTGTDIRLAWHFVHSFIVKHKKLHDLEEYNDYASLVLKSGFVDRVDILLKSTQIDSKHRDKVLNLLEKLLVELGGNLINYNSNDKFETRVFSLMNRIRNRMFVQSKRKTYSDKVRDILNHIEGVMIKAQSEE